MIAQFIIATMGSNAVVVDDTPQPINLTNANIVLDGNSYAVWGSPTLGDAIMDITPLDANGASLSNLGVGGQDTPDMIADYASQVTPLFEPGVANIYIMIEGSNDIYYGATAQEAFDNYVTLAQLAQADGYKVIAVGVMPRNQTGAYGSVALYNAELAAFNSLLAASTEFDAVALYHEEPEFADYDSSGYDADDIHPSDAGEVVIATKIVEAMVGLTE